MTPEEFRAVEERAQGYILHGHKRNHVLCVLLRFKPDVQPQVLRKLLQDLAAEVTSGIQIVQDKDDAKYVVRSIGLTWPGYKAIGLNHPERFSLEFQQGFASRAESVTKRPQDAGWDSLEWSPDAPYHVILIFAAGVKNSGSPNDASASSQDAQLLEIQKDIDKKFLGIADWTTWLHGFLNRDENGFTKENFGHADGVSNPVFKANPSLQTAGPDHFSSDAPLSLAFVREPYPAPDSNGYERGSYLTFLNIEQHPDKFKAATRCLAGALDKVSTETGTLIFGRQPDGSPLSGVGKTPGNIEQIKSQIAKHPSAIGATDEQKRRLLLAALNNFGYGKSGDFWPHASHIRKMNPRTDPSRRIVRRSCVYVDKEKNRHGVLFQCFQASIAQQFEFLMSNWANNPNQPVAGCGVDPIVGYDPLRRPQQWLAGKGNATPLPASISGLTTIRGGEYFYFPSIPSLRNLTKLP